MEEAMRVCYKGHNLIERNGECLLRKGHLCWDIMKEKKEWQGGNEGRKKRENKTPQAWLSL